MPDKKTGYEKVVVRRAGDLGTTTDSEPPAIQGVGDYGWGTDLKSPAWDKVKEKIDPDDFDPKTHVATIHYDLDAWEYTIEYLVEVERDA
jgi:hypothetical protein